MFVSDKPQGETQEQTIEPWRKVLLDAADHLQANGWWQCGASARGGAWCASNVLGKVGASDESEWIARKKLGRYLGGGDYLLAIFEWNDAPERTAAEVIATLRKVARS